MARRPGRRRAINQLTTVQRYSQAAEAIDLLMRYFEQRHSYATPEDIQLLSAIKRHMDYKRYSAQKQTLWSQNDFPTQYALPSKIHCCKRPNYDFCISQGSVATSDLFNVVLLID